MRSRHLMWILLAVVIAAIAMFVVESRTDKDLSSEVYLTLLGTVAGGIFGLANSTEDREDDKSGKPGVAGTSPVLLPPREQGGKPAPIDEGVERGDM